MKYIPLTNSNKKAIVDDENYALVSRFSWHKTKDGHAGTYIHGELVLMENLIHFPEVRKWAESAEGTN